MLRFLRWIFGNDVAEVENRRVDEAKPVVHRSSRSRQNRVSDVYFDSMSRMRTAISDGLGPLAAAALRYDRLGRVAARKALQHGVYRVGVHPLGQGLIAMSRDCIVHAYDDNLEPVLETALADAPEVLALRKRFDIPDDQLKNHIRCVALSRGANRYLVTAVDEAWCVDTTGQTCWGVKLPMKEGWSRIAAPSHEFGTSADVDQALALMDLSLPFTPETLKERYWDLAKRSRAAGSDSP